MSDLNEFFLAPKVLPPHDVEIQSIRASVAEDYEAHKTPNSARALREAADENLEVVFPAKNQLQIDIDSDHAFNIYQETKEIVERYYGLILEDIKPSRSGLPKRHITITLYGDLNEFERIALQACLGSDRIREILSVIQARHNDPHPTLFLEKKKNATLPVPTGSDRSDSN